jgi:hypothetical protein
MGRGVEGAIDEENQVGWVKIDLSAEGTLSSTAKTYVKGTGMLKFDRPIVVGQDDSGADIVESVGHSIRVNFLQNLPKEEYKARKRRDLEAELADLDS